MSNNDNYLHKVLTVTVVTTVILIAASFIPSFRIGDTTVKRVNFISDLCSFDDSVTPTQTSESLIDTSFLSDAPSDSEIEAMICASTRGTQIASPDSLPACSPATLPDPLPDAAIAPQSSAAKPALPFQSEAKVPALPSFSDTSPTYTIAALASPATTTAVPEPTESEVVDSSTIPTQQSTDGTVMIEDYSPSHQMMDRFYRTLAGQSGSRTVRIAALGDSFIESDILTCDLREELQSDWGGTGVGFVPFANPLSKYRATVRHEYSGWDYYNIIKKKQVPEHYKQLFFVSGILSVPQQGAVPYSRFGGVKYRQRLDRTNGATIIFTNSGQSTMEVVVNDTLRYNYTLAQSPDIQSITIDAPIASLAVSLPQCNGFVGYGVVLEGNSGVSVHNFAVRSNSGVALFSTNRTINLQINQLMNYDLIILQYGLNAMSASVTDYKYYGTQLRKVVNYMKACFPNSAVMLMSVGDRSIKSNDRYVTMKAACAMLEMQRQVAKECGVAFWNTFEAMGGQNSMPRFVANGWAAKDYTHINYKGGKAIADRLVESIKSRVDNHSQQQPDPQLFGCRFAIAQD